MRGERLSGSSSWSYFLTPSMKRFFRSCVVIVLLCLLGMAGEGPRVRASETPSNEPVKLKVLQLPYAPYAALFMAREEGYFSEQGLDVEFVKMDLATKAIPALLSGELDAAAFSVRISLLNAIARGGNAKIVAGVSHIPASTECPVLALLAKDAVLEQNSLEQPDQWQQIRANTIQGSAIHYALEKALVGAGFRTDQIMVKNLPFPIASEAFQKDALDLVLLDQPSLLRELRRGESGIWVTASEVVPELQLDVVAYGARLLTEEPEIGQRFMVAYLKGVRQYLQGKTPRNVELFSRHIGVEEDLIQEMCWSSVRDDGSIDSESILDFQHWLVEKGWLDQVVPVEQFWDDRFIRHANEVLGAPPQE